MSLDAASQNLLLKEAQGIKDEKSLQETKYNSNASLVVFSSDTKDTTLYFFLGPTKDGITPNNYFFW